uniref:TOG domain-containing protein n=1 Tax=Macrostomum lignano TaxID=282301 RepID=A0A1I8IBS8_9PLAT
NLAEILAQLQSSEWSCRRDGLASFSSYLAREGGPSLNQLELRRVCDIFAKMFGEPNGRVMQFFLEALADFVTRYHGELHDWLYTLLVRLVGRMATETLASQQARFQPSPRVQAALLQCLLQVVRQLPADALVPWRNQSDQPGQEARIALSRLTTLTKDPKSPDVRRLSQAVLAALFDLNPGCFSAVLKEMQPTIQQRATDVLRLQLGPKAAGVGSSRICRDAPEAAAGVWAAKFCCSDAPAPLSARGGVTRPAAAVVRRAAPATSAAAAPAAAAAANAAANAGDGSDDLLNSIHMAALNLQSFTRTAEDADATENKAPLIEALPAPTPVRPAQLANGRAPASALQPSRQQQQQQPPLTAGGPRQQQATVAESTLGQPDFEDFDDDEELLDDDDEDIDEMSTDDAVTGILKELSNHNQRHEQRMSSMQRLVRMVRDNSVDSWDENFKTVLLILLETLGDNEADIRALALTVLQELIRAQPRRLSNYTELTLHRDTDKLVAKAAEDCAKHVAAHLPGDVCLRVLTPLVSGADPGLALAAVKMQMRVVQECEPRAVEAALPELCPGLVRCCDHAESQIRKAAIFCLVQMYMKVGETLLLHLKDMSSTKRRLLQLYICKARVGTAQDGGGGGGGAGGVALPPAPKYSSCGAKLSACSTKMSDCGAEMSACGTKMSDCGAKISDCGAEMSACGTKMSNCGAKMSDCGAKITDRNDRPALSLVDIGVGSVGCCPPAAAMRPALRSTIMGDCSLKTRFRFRSLLASSTALSPRPPSGCTSPSDRRLLASRFMVLSSFSICLFFSRSASAAFACSSAYACSSLHSLFHFCALFLAESSSLDSSSATRSRSASFLASFSRSPAFSSSTRRLRSPFSDSSRVTLLRMLSISRPASSSIFFIWSRLSRSLASCVSRSASFRSSFVRCSSNSRRRLARSSSRRFAVSSLSRASSSWASRRSAASFRAERTAASSHSRSCCRLNSMCTTWVSSAIFFETRYSKLSLGSFRFMPRQPEC